MDPNMSSLKCLICGLNNCSKDKSSLKSSENLISQNLHVIFLLRNVLEVPSEKLITYLKTSPNLDSWLSVCDKCEDGVNKCKTIYQDILTVQSQFRKVKHEIIQRLKESPFVKQEPISHDDEDNTHFINIKIVEEIRGYVYQNEYPEVTADPFISGDQYAYQHQKSTVKLEKEDEEETDDDDDNQSLDEEDEDMGDPTSPYASSEPEVLSPQGTIDDNPTMYKCSSCGANSPNQASLLLHQNNCTGVSFPCPLAPTCQHRFSERPHLLTHLYETHATDPNLPPPIKRLIAEENLRISRLKFKCSKCGAVKSSKEELEAHPIHCSRNSSGSEKKNWTCPVASCGQILKSEFKVKVHLRRMHKELMKKDDGPPQTFLCETCGVNFHKKDFLAKHRNTNIKCKRMRGEWKEEDKVTCDICGKSYPSDRHLRQHMLHVHEKRFGKRCKWCGLLCDGQSYLDKHLWSRHRIEGATQKKLVKCGVEGCEVIMRGQKFNAAHMRRMHGERERKWKCDKCGKKYLMKAGLLQHWKEFQSHNKEGKGIEKVGVGLVKAGEGIRLDN